MNKSFILSIMAVLFLSGCGQKNNQPPAFPPAEVGVVTITQEALPVVAEFPGRLDAVRTAEVRARATGILLKRTFDEGAEVKEGQTLFEIDAAPLQASFNSAEAVLAKAEATLIQAQSRAKRFETLIAEHAVSQQEYEDANATALQVQADVQAAKAARENAKLNLDYATVTAPITGRIGAAKVTEGALVSQSQATPLAVISQLDPIYFDFSQSSADGLRLRKLFDQGKLQSSSSQENQVTLLLEDGSVYPLGGKLLFSDVNVDPTTGMVTMRAEFPNPDHWLLPGMFARVRLQQGIDENAIRAPQRAVVLGPNGTASVSVVGVDNKIENRLVKLGSAIGDQWIVLEGLKAGEKVVVEGLQKIRPGAEVKPVPFKKVEDQKK